MFPVHFHSWGAGRHAWNGNPEQVITFAHRNDLLGGHVTFNKLSVDGCCVTGRELRRNPETALDRAHVGFHVINDGKAAGFKVLDPFLAASAISVAMYIDRQWLCCVTG